MESQQVTVRRMASSVVTLLRLVPAHGHRLLEIVRGVLEANALILGPTTLAVADSRPFTSIGHSDNGSRFRGEPSEGLCEPSQEVQGMGLSFRSEVHVEHPDSTDDDTTTSLVQRNQSPRQYVGHSDTVQRTRDGCTTTVPGPGKFTIWGRTQPTESGTTAPTVGNRWTSTKRKYRS